MSDYKIKQMLLCKWVNCLLLIALFTYFFILPGLLTINFLNDKALSEPGIPKIALHTHRLLTNRFGKWLQERIDSKRATELTIHNISGTEWPLFGTVFYLWATEAIEEELKRQGAETSRLPSTYAKETLQLAAEFLNDPNQAQWVKDHWGEDYLHRENLFYRMLLMGGLLSYQNILKDNEYEDILRDQVTTLAKELDESPHGLLDDYPGQCYPIDIIAAIAVIKRADSLLGTDHSLFVQRAVRGFQGERLDSKNLLPSYTVNSITGKGFGLV